MDQFLIALFFQNAQTCTYEDGSNLQPGQICKWDNTPTAQGPTGLNNQGESYLVKRTGTTAYYYYVNADGTLKRVEVQKHLW